MRRVRLSGHRVEHLLGVAVVGRHRQHHARVAAGRLEDAEASVERLDRRDRFGELAGMADHVGVGEIDDVRIVPARRQGADGFLGDLRRAHLRVKVVGRSLPGGDEDALFAGIGLLDAAVEEVGHVRVLLGLGQAQVLDAGRGPHVRENVDEVLRRERRRQAELLLVFGEADEVNPGRLRPREIREPGLRQRPRDLPGAVRAEVEEDDGVAVVDRADGLTVLDEDGRLNELVGLAPGVGLGDRFRGAAPPGGRTKRRGPAYARATRSHRLSRSMA